MATKPDSPERWSVRRWKQLELLRHVLSEAKLLNHGSNVVGRIKRLEAASDILTSDRYSSRTGEHMTSFIRFLEEQARHCYSTRRRRAKATGKEPA